MNRLLMPLLGVLFALPSHASDPEGLTERVSLSSSGSQGDGASGTGPLSSVAVSSNGRVVVFGSVAANLVPGDTNGVRDAFVRDLDLDVTERVSLSDSGGQINDHVNGVTVSGDGRYVLFTTAADNLHSFDTNGLEDVFLRDRVNGTTTLVSRTPLGIPGNGTSQGGYLSDDGRYAGFFSSASNLVAGDTNDAGDVFVFDRFTSSVTRVSVHSDGTQGDGNSRYMHISGTGRYVVFVTDATNIAGSGLTPSADIILRDLVQSTTQVLGPGFFSPQWDADPQWPTVSDDGRFVAFESPATNVVPGDTNGAKDVFVWDVQTSSATRLSVGPGQQEGDGPSRRSRISRDGSAVVFQSEATNLVAGDTNGWTDIFVADLASQSVTRASVATDGSQANVLSGHPSISGNAARVAFTSSATNLVPGDTNEAHDVFARLCGAPPPILYCSTDDNSLGCAPDITAEGTASASLGSGFDVTTRELLNGQFGLLIYSTTGAQEVPFGNQFLCVQPPITRTPVQNSGGSPPPTVDCSGELSFDFNAWITSGVDPSLTVGVSVWCQYWSRDPGAAAPNSFHLTEGITFVIGP